MDNAVPWETPSSYFCVYVSSQRIPGCMKFEGYKISGVKVVNIMEENAEAIEKMVNQAIGEVYQQKLKILDIQTTGDNMILVLGEKSWPSPWIKKVRAGGSSSVGRVSASQAECRGFEPRLPL